MTPRARRRGRPAGTAGFTLLEVLVALAILGLAIVASIQGFAQGLRLLKLAGDHQEAMLIADQKAREVVLPEAGREEGTEGAFAWERTTKSVEAPDLTPAGTPVAWKVYEIAVRVRWGETRYVEIATLRTVPAVNPAPGAAPETASSGTGASGTTAPGTTSPGTAASGTGTPGAGARR